jgi:alpha-mannosidase
VDTFGHISQAPQLHRLFDISAVYIWRGHRDGALFPLAGAGRQPLFTCNLFGGLPQPVRGHAYAGDRSEPLLAELEKLRPYYPPQISRCSTATIWRTIPKTRSNSTSTQADSFPRGCGWWLSPQAGLRARCAKLGGLPVLIRRAEFGQVRGGIPGQPVHARTYLKVMAWDCERLLYRSASRWRCWHPRRARVTYTGQYEAWSRALLQNSVHDCICGVSIDQVHEKMEHSYRQVFEGMQADLGESLAHILDGYEPGLYCVSTNPIPYEGRQVSGESHCTPAYRGARRGAGREGLPVRKDNREVETFMENEYYQAQVDAGWAGTDREGCAGDADGLRGVRGHLFGGIGAPFGTLEVDGGRWSEQESAVHAVLRLVLLYVLVRGERYLPWLRLTFDHSPAGALAGGPGGAWGELPG